jgi:hypothetical protein
MASCFDILQSPFLAHKKNQQTLPANIGNQSYKTLKLALISKLKMPFLMNAHGF